MNITYEFDLPPTLNEIIAASAKNRYVGGKLKKEWTERIANETADTIQFPGKVWMSFTWQLKYFARDPDNIQAAKKYILDGLQGLKVDKKSTDYIIPPVIKKDSLMIIQSPIIEWFERGEDKVIILITENPLDILQPCIDMYEEIMKASA